MPPRSLFRDGLPSRFLLTVTLRVAERSRLAPWFVLRIDDPQGGLQFGVLLDGLTNDVTVYVPTNQRRAAAIEFDQNRQYIRRVNGFLYFIVIP